MRPPRKPETKPATPPEPTPESKPTRKPKPDERPAREVEPVKEKSKDMEKGITPRVLTKETVSEGCAKVLAESAEEVPVPEPTTPKYLTVSMTDDIHIQPTRDGLGILQATHDQFRSGLPSGTRGGIPVPVHVFRKTDEDGWLRYSVQELMEQLGPNFRMGKPIPFAGEFRVVVK